MKLDSIHIYPVKSIAGITLKSSQVKQSGLFDDRRYMLAFPNGNFITARQYPILTQVQAEYDTQGLLSLTYQGDTITLDNSLFSSVYKTVRIWETDLNAQMCGPSYNQWFSQIIGKDVELVYFCDKSERVTGSRPDKPVAFADGYPFTIASKASLDALKQVCPEKVNIAQFRANLIIDGCEAFAEDTWAKFRIGDVIFEAVKPSVRCTLTMVDPETGKFNEKGEPFKSLIRFRFLKQDGKNKGPTFAMNLVALNEGSIKTGDELEVLAYREAEFYG